MQYIINSQRKNREEEEEGEHKTRKRIWTEVVHTTRRRQIRPGVLRSGIIERTAKSIVRPPQLIPITRSIWAGCRLTRYRYSCVCGVYFKSFLWATYRETYRYFKYFLVTCYCFSVYYILIMIHRGVRRFSVKKWWKKRRYNEECRMKNEEK